MVLKAWEIVFKYHHLAGIFLVALVTGALYLKTDINRKIVQVQEIYEAKRSNSSSCDLSSGKWVYDNTYPLYKERQCAFIEADFACERQGRKEFKYRNWRWQPHHCDLPRFDATAFLEKIRGKKIVYVGDSIMRNLWLSMLCLLGPAVPPSNALLIQQHIFSIPVPDYNVRVNHYWSPLLVESNRDDPVFHKAINMTLRIEAIENHGRHWNDVDILVFDSFAWWLDQNFTLLWGSFGSSDAIYKLDVMRLRHFEIAMKTWSDWLELNINRTKTKIFFMSMSPVHSRGEHWGAEKGTNCYGETEQIPYGEEHWGPLINHGHMAVVKSTIEELGKRGVHVQYVNITQLSAYRKDAHPSVHGSFPVPHEFRNKSSNPVRYADCLHWCLPGVPDVWNQFLYAYIMNS